VVLACAACGGLLLVPGVARPATVRPEHRPAHSFALASMLPPAVVGVAYPPKPYAKVSVCRPMPPSGDNCGAYAFFVAKKHGALPTGLTLGMADGTVEGTPAWESDLVQPAGSSATGLYSFLVCARMRGRPGTVCKPTRLAVFTGLAGTWTGEFHGDAGAFTCATPPSGPITLVLTQTVSYPNEEPRSSVAGTATLGALPPISPNGEHTGDCTQMTRSLTVAGTVVNPSASGPDSAHGLWNANLTSDGKLSGSLTIQDSGNHGYYSRLSFTLTRQS
jgi:hypothetical protein